MSRSLMIALVVGGVGSRAYAQAPEAPPDAPPGLPTETLPPPPPQQTAPPPPIEPTVTESVPAPPQATLAPPIRVAIQCEEPGRTKACPAFLLGLVDANKVLLNSPRSAADVTVYATANEVALVDRLHLRFVGKMAGAPSVLELDVDIDTRGTDDEQRAAIEPALLGGLSLFVRARYPDAVKVELSTPSALAPAGTAGSPWGVMLEFEGNGNYTEKYRSASTEIALVGRYVTRRLRALVGNFTNAGINRQPPLMLDDGTTVSLDSHNWAIRGGAEVIKLFNDSWSVGVGSYTNFEDPKSQYRYNSRTRAAIAWDMFPADDPRGNRLEVFYHLGWAIERYNIRNELGERFAQYPLHGIDAVGSVRHDKLSYGLHLSSDVQLNHPGRRHLVTAAPFGTIQLGTHVDLNLSLSITQRELPAPDMAAIDPSDYAQLSRLSFAEPLQINASIGLQIHWDPTNGVRNDRIESI